MNKQDWGALALLTVRDPAEAARQVMAMDLPRQVLWLALIVVSLLNTILLFTPAVVAGLPVLLPGMLANPVPYFVMVSVGLVVMIHVLHWIGLKMGGTGTLGDVAAVLIWMQALRVAVQAVSLVLQFVFPLFTIFLAVAVGVYQRPWLKYRMSNSSARNTEEYRLPSTINWGHFLTISVPRTQKQNLDFCKVKPKAHATSHIAASEVLTEET